MIKIIYDGECPFCKSYVQISQLKKAIGNVALINARDLSSDDLNEFKVQGYNLDEGMLVKYEGQTYYGSDALNIISILSSRSGFINKIMATIFANKKIARVAYPILKLGRSITLKILGKAKLHKKNEETKCNILNFLPYFVMLAPLASLIGVSVGYSGINYLEKIYPDYVSAPKLANPDNYYAAYFAINIIFLVASFFKKFRETIFSLLLNLDWRMWAAFLIYIITCANLMDIVILRRIAFGAASIPCLGIALYGFAIYKKNNVRDYVAALSMPLLAFIIMIPGFYFPPFYGGIAGWTSGDLNENTPASYAGYQLVRSDGETVWYTSNFFSPVTQIGRFQKALNYTMKDKQAEKFMYLFDNYSRIYPELKKGHLPHQKILGRYGYPSHNLSKFDPKYIDFAPSDIVYIREVQIDIERKTGETIAETIMREYDVVDHKMVR